VCEGDKEKGAENKMDDDDLDSGLFNISISDSEGDGDDDVDTSHGFAQGKSNKADRKGQSEAQFQVVKRDYRPKVENGEVSKASHHHHHHLWRFSLIVTRQEKGFRGP
jgi:hypothetical protein